MRAFLITIVAIFIAGSATAATAVPADTDKKISVTDQKYGGTRYATKATKSTESDFVGTSAKPQTTKKKQPSWIVFGHP